jgi:muramoyltetrapeptide carboxypeptidase LdcA involved in peptidoglycan recycling
MSFVDERLVHLRSAGLLRDVRGIVFGHLSLDRCEEDEFENSCLICSRFRGSDPDGFPGGHEAPNLTLPLGTEVELVVGESTGSSLTAKMRSQVVMPGELSRPSCLTQLASQPAH